MAVFFSSNLPLAAVLALAGIVGIVTGALSHCTIYTLLGMNTLEKKE